MPILSYRSGDVEVYNIGQSDPDSELHIDLHLFIDCAEVLMEGSIKIIENDEKVLEDAAFSNMKIVLTEAETNRLTDLLRASVIERQGYDH